VGTLHPRHGDHGVHGRVGDVECRAALHARPVEAAGAGQVPALTLLRTE
jgi:hypothetical protein